MSVTWRLTEAEQDLPLAVSVLAEEAERALDQADRRVRNLAAAPQTSDAVGKPLPASPGNGHGPTFGNGHGPTTSHGPNTSHGWSGGTGERGVTAPRSEGSAAPSRKSEKPPSKAAPAAPRTAGGPDVGGPNAVGVPPPITAPPITAPQRLAIRSLCARMEVADPELTLLLEEHFDKKRLEELSKSEAGALLDALQRGAWESEAEAFASAN